MKKTFYLRSLTLILAALLLLSGCKAPVTEPATEPYSLKGTMTVEPLDLEKLKEEPKVGASYKGGSLFGDDFRMLECAATGTVLDAESVIIVPDIDSTYVPNQRLFIRYQIKIEEVKEDPSSTLKAGETITLYHGSYLAYNAELDAMTPRTLKKGVTYVMTFMPSHEYRYYYNSKTLGTAAYHYVEYKGEGVEVVWKLPLKKIGDYCMDAPNLHAFEVQGDKLLICDWGLDMADRYLGETVYAEQLENQVLSGLYDYVIDHDFFPQFYQAMVQDIEWYKSAKWSFFLAYLYKHDREEYDKYIERMEKREETYHFNSKAQ